MSDESTAVQMARIEERMKIIIEGLAQDRISRKEQYEKMEELSQTLTSVDGRVKTVEESLKQQAPTIEEFITIKHKVVGAGMAGKWIWVVLAGLVGFAFSMRVEIIKWLTKS